MNNDIQTLLELSIEKIKSHPFIVSANQRILTKQQSLRWVYCAGRESQSFPGIIVEMLKTVQDPTIRNILELNLSDELGSGLYEHAHFMHYLQLLEMLGVSENSFYGYKEQSGINLALNLASNISKSNNIAYALGYMIVNEAMTPVTYLAAKSTLTKYFPNIDTRFFDMHIEVDEQHVADLYRAIDKLKGSIKDVQFGIELGERGMASLLDEAYGIYDIAEEDITGVESCPETHFKSLLDKAPISFSECN